MKKESMTELVKMYEALNSKMDQVQELLLGSSHAVGFDDGLFGTFTYVYAIIRRECDQSLINDDLELEDNEYHRILLSELTAEQKADALLGEGLIVWLRHQQKTAEGNEEKKDSTTTKLVEVKCLVDTIRTTSSIDKLAESLNKLNEMAQANHRDLGEYAAGNLAAWNSFTCH